MYACRSLDQLLSQINHWYSDAVIPTKVALLRDPSATSSESSPCCSKHLSSAPMSWIKKVLSVPMLAQQTSGLGEAVSSTAHALQWYRKIRDVTLMLAVLIMLYHSSIMIHYMRR